MACVTRPFSWTYFVRLFDYWELFKLGVIGFSADIELSYIRSFRCDSGRRLLQQTITTLFVLKLLFIVLNTLPLFYIYPIQ